MDAVLHRFVFGDDLEEQAGSDAQSRTVFTGSWQSKVTWTLLLISVSPL